jgi:hypothetical protein
MDNICSFIDDDSCTSVSTIAFGLMLVTSVLIGNKFPEFLDSFSGGEETNELIVLASES